MQKDYRIASKIKSRKLIFIDFDDVLFNTRAFKKNYFRVFSRFGVPARKAIEAYLEMRKDIGRDDPRIHIARLKKQYHSLRGAELENALYRLRGRGREYVFKDVVPFLRSLRGSGRRMELISSGDPRVQRKKILSSGLNRCFNGKIHLVDNDYKSKTVKEVFGRKKTAFVFIDDKKTTVDEIKKTFPYSFVIQVVRHRDQERARAADLVVRSLKELHRL